MNKEIRLTDNTLKQQCYRCGELFCDEWQNPFLCYYGDRARSLLMMLASLVKLVILREGIRISHHICPKCKEEIIRQNIFVLRIIGAISLFISLLTIKNSSVTSTIFCVHGLVFFVFPGRIWNLIYREKFKVSLVGEVTEEGYYINGTREGVHKFFNKNGILVGEVTFLNGSQEGLSRQFHPNGKVAAEENYVFGKKQGLVKRYYDNGTMQSEINYTAGKMDGVCKIYHKDGRSWETQIYKDDRLLDETGKFFTGIKEGFMDNGTLASKIEFKEGKMDGRCVLYNEDGSIKREIFYKNGTVLS